MHDGAGRAICLPHFIWCAWRQSMDLARIFLIQSTMLYITIQF